MTSIYRYPKITCAVAHSFTLVHSLVMVMMIVMETAGQVMFHAVSLHNECYSHSCMTSTSY